MDAEDKLERIRQLHYRSSDDVRDTFIWCRHCGAEWPCPTIQVIDRP